MSPPAPLGHLRVVEAATGIAGAYAGKLLADAGADVILLEPPGGNPLRSQTATGADPGAADAALFRFLAAGKRSVTGTLGTESTAALIAGADILIEDQGAAALAASGVLDDPTLVVLSITPFGTTGPLADRPANEFIVQAESGSLAARGRPERTPVAAGGRIAEWGGGVYGAAAALAAAGAAERTGRGAHVDVSLQEVMVIATNLFMDLTFRLLGVPPEHLPQPARATDFPSIEPTTDGWVGFNTNAMEMFNDFLVLIERGDLLEVPGIRTDLSRRAELEAAATAWTSQHTTAEVIELASLLRIPVAAVPNGETLPLQEHFAARGIYETTPDGMVRPRPPYRFNGQRPVAGTTAPRLGEHDGRIEPRPRRAATAAVDPEAPAGLPFDGLRVLDLTSWWAGPASTQFLAALGADVIHVESPQRIDAMRPAATLPFVDRERWWEYSPFFLHINPNKRGLTLDLSDPRGKALALRLIEWADVVVENYTPRVMANLGLDWDVVHATNSRAVMVRMPAYGLDGPWRDRVGFAQTMEAHSGMAWVTGYRDGPPMLPRGPCDPLGGAHAAFAIGVALAQRDATGEGLLVEAALIETALNVSAVGVLEFSAYGKLFSRDGNRIAGCAPQGVYRCAGTEQWLAVSVATDEQWAALRTVLGGPEWAGGALDTYAGRAAAADRIDEELGRWAADRDLSATVDELVAAGVPAAALADHRSLHRHPHLRARGFLERSTHPVVGPHDLFAMPLRYTGVERWIRTPAPTVGQHNEEILGGLLGVSPEELEVLARDKVIGTAPSGVA